METRRIKLFLGGIVVYFGISFFLLFTARNIELDYEINGRVDKIVYGDKEIPTILVGGKSFVVTFPNEYFKLNISVGDSLVKYKNSRIYIMIKKNSNNVLYSDKNEN